MNELQRLKQSILKDAPRFTEKDTFKFTCHKGLSCFTQCCADVNIFLTPYDVLRMKNHLKISSGEFLVKYTLVPFTKDQHLPLVVLKMNEEDKRCPFVSDEGCSIYEDRPWSCRMYPLGLASPKEGACPGEHEFYFLMQEGDCKGFADGKEITVREWLEDQGIIPYNEIGELLKAITLHHHFMRGRILDPDEMEMFYMACYDIDKFRRFVFESNFLNYFDVEDEVVNTIRTDDVELMKFAFQWLRFSLFREPTMKIREDVLEDKKKSMGNI
jgi:Fe-S-cluster containining protein